MTSRQQQSARAICVRAASLMLAHRDAVHYTQGALRWQGIDQKLRVVKNQYPKFSDCSSNSSWILWNALTHALGTFNVADIVNGEHWQAGYTGTIAQHGRRVSGAPVLGDLILYGSGWPFEHVTLALGGGMCFSHGSENGPYKLPVNYRPIAEVRRFIV